MGTGPITSPPAPVRVPTKSGRVITTGYPKGRGAREVATLVLGVVHRVLGEVHRVLGVVQRVLGVVHRVLGIVHRVLGVVHRVLGVLHRVLGRQGGCKAGTHLSNLLRVWRRAPILTSRPQYPQFPVWYPQYPV